MPNLSEPKRLKLTQAAAKWLKPPVEGAKPATYWDTQLPGFGLRITARGRRTWLAMYRVNGKAVMETLGTMAETPNVAEARDRARASMTRAREGKNPVDEKREEERRAAQAATEAAVRAVTFEHVAKRFLQEHIAVNAAPKYKREVWRVFNHDLLPGWHDRPVREISRHDVNDLLDAKASGRERRRTAMRGGAAVQANRLLTLLRTFFKWAAGKDLVVADPTAGVSARIKEKARDRALDDAEIHLFLCGCDKLSWPFGPLFKLLLLTAQRRDEVGGLRWSELDLDRRVWTIPRERAKSDRAHIVHLSVPAVAILEALPRTGELVFSATGATAVSGYSRAKARVDRLMMDKLRKDAGNPEAMIAPWVLHDLRRTATTGMAGLGVAPHVVDKILNHSAGTIRGVAAVYNRHAYLDERKAALEAWGKHVCPEAYPPEPARDEESTNIVPFKTGTR